MRQQHPNTLHNGTRGSGRAAMGIRVRASAFAHPKSPHVAALDERHFVSALQLVLPRRGGDAGDGASATEGFADVSDALRRRGAGGGVDGASSLVGPAPDGDDFRIARMTLAQLVDDAFLAQHVRPESGARFFACPLDGRLDADDVVVRVPRPLQIVVLAEPQPGAHGDERVAHDGATGDGDGGDVGRVHAYPEGGDGGDDEAVLRTPRV